MRDDRGGEITPGPVWFGDGAAQGLVQPLSVSSEDTLAVAEVVVVGLGASGLTAVVALATAGVAVVGIDEAGVGSGAAGANGGFLLGGLAAFHHDAVQRYGRDVASRWYAATLDELARTIDEEPTARRTGILRSAADPDEVADLRSQHVALRRDGIDAELVDGPLGPALLVADDGVFDPMARCRRLAGEALAAGATLVGATRVTVRAGGALEAGGRLLAPRATIVAVDGGLEGAVPALRHEVTSIRLQMQATAPQEQRLLERPLYHRWGYDYAQQLPTGELAVGGGRDLEDARARGGAPTPTPVVQRHIDTLAARLGSTAPVTHRWAARSAYTRDLLPIVAEVAPRVHVVGGYSGHGNVLGVLLARRTAARVQEHLAAAGSPER